ncbi:MAG: NAD-dependent epimerase/dehydratase family protein [Acidimicrobiales bacterium]
MKVFVAGATGVIGWRAVARLVGEGHDVSGLARSDQKAALLERLGARPVRAELFNREAMFSAVAGHEVVCNLATSIPPLTRAMGRDAWATNDRIRREGSAILVDAALASGAARYIQESLAFTYADGGDQWIDEDWPLQPAGYASSVLEAERQAARFASTDQPASSKRAAVVLRFGQFYGPDSSHTITSVKLARRGIPAMLGRPEAYLASISTDDAAGAVAAALRVPSGAYNVVDDQPLTRRQWAEALQAALGFRHRVRLSPQALTRLGGDRVEMLARSQRVCNGRLRSASDWTPAWRSIAEGWPAVIAAMTGSEHR